MHVWRMCVAVAVVLTLAASHAAAQEQDDEAFDEALKNYGYSGGAAWQCADDDNVRGALVTQATTVFNRLSQLFGTDRAFLFAAAFGAGSVDGIDRAICSEYSANFATGMNPGIAAERGE